MTGDYQGIDTIVDDPSPPSADFELGDSFASRYRVERCLGRGSMGTVYAVFDQVVGERVALKLLALPKDDSIEGFRREVRLARRVTHRNAARTFDLGAHAGVHFITMELIEGESLRVLLARRVRLPEPEAVSIAWQLCLGLQAAHAVEVVHRDLKPANILVEEGGRAVITDFGVAGTLSEGADSTEERARGMGTPMYMAPEQVLGSPFDGRVDIYALGLVLYEMLTGKPAFSGGSKIEIAMARLSRPPPDPREHAEVSDLLAELVLRCLAQSPDDRPATPGELAKRLAALGANAKDPPASVATEPETTSGSGTGPFAPTSVGDRKLAVMSFRYRGNKEHAYLAEVLTDELVDLLAMTRGLRVSASGAANRFRDERDARTVGRALGVDAIVDGSVLYTGDQIRIVTRLIDVETGFQSWTERFAGRMDDVLDLQDLMAKRVAEALRVELAVLDQGRTVPGEAIELYLQGRQRSREPDVSGRSLEGAIALYDRALERAPSFALALAARAEAAVQRWFLPSAREADGWDRISTNAVHAALEGAAHLAESRIAAARLDVSHGEFASAARHLSTALEIAPTCAPAHEYLGLLQCDAGRSREGVRHIELAHELDPSLFQGAFSVLRHHALRGERERWKQRLEQMRLSPRFPGFALALFEYRLALWDGDVQWARDVRWRADSDPNSSTARLASLLQDALDHSAFELGRRFDALIEPQSSPRLRTHWRQMAVEVLAWRGERDLALDQLQKAEALGVLLDADWFDACPVLEPLRSTSTFAEIHERVHERAEAIWRTAGA
ncbi:serine/threonine-protein kinase [Paraliomyxa miuraensis]|uniref:serine/threonine-protein kinase n=1 Tax=Paraliomyxa miuraensis TaxID=376150 RepID=UPI002254132E|nr:serine/threonine-protein kinase [Paraliomyxa miuraensis]MCX4241601.1 protein kinase [Paraliomyxa miuraensis]